MRGYSYKTKWAQEKFPGKVYIKNSEYFLVIWKVKTNLYFT